MKPGTVIDEAEFEAPDVIDESQFEAPDVAVAPVTPAPKPRERSMAARVVSQAQSAGQGAGQGLTAGWADEIMGGLSAVDEFQRRTGWDPNPERAPVEREDLGLLDAMAARYRRERDANRQDAAVAFEANPKTYVGGMVGGGLLGPTPGSKGQAFGRLMGATGMGMAAAAGGSEADNLKDFGADVGVGGLLGMGGGAFAQGGSVFAGKLRSLIEKIKADKLAKEIKELEKIAASARGKAGSDTRRVIDSIEEADKYVDPNLTRADPEVVAAAEGTLAKPVAGEFEKNAAMNKFGQFDSDVARAQEAQRLMAEAAANIPERAAAKAADHFENAGPISEALKRVPPLAQRAAMGAAGGLVGQQLFGTTGAIGGFATGFSAPGTIQAARNWAKTPAVQAGLAGWGIQAGEKGGGIARSGAQSAAIGAPGDDDSATYNAIDELAKRYGIDVGSKEELADQWWLKNN